MSSYSARNQRSEIWQKSGDQWLVDTFLFWFELEGRE